MKDLVQIAFDYVSLNWEDYVVVDPKFVRHTEVDLLLGNATKARKKLGWKPEVDFKSLTKMMVDADLEKIKNDIHLSNIQAQKNIK